MVRARVRRIFLLLTLIVLLSLGDLIATMTYLTSTGMEELNPLAIYIVRHNSYAGLILFKFGSVLASISLILLVRHRRQGEVAAWIGALILVGLTVQWSIYSDSILNLHDTIVIEQAQDSPEWIKFGTAEIFGSEAVGSQVAPNGPPAEWPLP